MSWFWRQIRRSVPLMLVFCLLVASISYALTSNLADSKSGRNVSASQQETLIIQPIQETTFEINPQMAKAAKSFFVGGVSLLQKGEASSVVLPTRRDTASLAIAEDESNRIVGMALSIPLVSMKGIVTSFDYKTTALAKLILLPGFTTSNPLELAIIYGAAATSPALDKLAAALEIHAGQDPNYFTNPNEEEDALLSQLAQDTMTLLSDVNERIQINGASFALGDDGSSNGALVLSDAIFREKTFETQMVAKDDGNCSEGLAPLTPLADVGVCLNQTSQNETSLQIEAENTSYIWTLISNSNTYLLPKTFHLPLVFDLVTHAAEAVAYSFIAVGVGLLTGEAPDKTKLKESVDELRSLQPINSGEKVSITLAINAENEFITAYRPAVVENSFGSPIYVRPDLTLKEPAKSRSSGDRSTKSNPRDPFWENIAGTLLFFTIYTQIVEPLVGLLQGSPMPLCKEFVTGGINTDMVPYFNSLINNLRGSQNLVEFTAAGTKATIDTLSLPGMFEGIIKCAKGRGGKNAKGAFDKFSNTEFIKKLRGLAVGYLRPDSRINAAITVVNVMGSAGGILNSYRGNEQISQWQVNSLEGLPPSTIKPSVVSEGTLIIEDWFGKGWIGTASNCESILMIANTFSEAKLKEWEIWKGLRVVALNPSTGTLLTYYVSSAGGSQFSWWGKRSTKGKFSELRRVTNEFMDSDKYWAPYDLYYENGKFICEKRRS